MKAKDGMSSFDIRVLVRELQSLIGAHFVKAYDPGERGLLLRFKVPSGPRYDLLVHLGRFICPTRRRVDVPPKPGQFPSALRRHLKNFRVQSIYQHDFDRIVVFRLGIGGDYRLVLEMFGRGNAILLSENRIFCLYEARAWKDRVLRPGGDYAFPPEKANPLMLDADALASVLTGGKDLVRSLALNVNLGGTYAEEVCLRSGVEKTKRVEDLSADEMDSVYEAIRSLVSEIERPRPQIVYLGGEMVDVVPFDLKIYAEMERVYYLSFGEALDAFFSLPVPDEEPGERTDLARIQHTLRTQMKAVEDFKRKAGFERLKADAIYANYGRCEEAMQIVKGLLQETDWHHISSRLPDWIQPLDDYGKIAVKLEHHGRPIEVLLDLKAGINGNAARYYQAAKKFRAKMSGALEAIEETKRRMEKRRGEKGSRKRRKYTRDFWFEKYRWCLTSGGRLMLGGRDVRTNEEVVRKHLKDGDRYAHADVHGAPSIVLKRGADASEEELREACVFACIYSKAWNAGLGSAAAYWVMPDQVSKTPESGEYLAKGAFVIRGRRNYCHKVPMRAALGVVKIDGKEKVMAGPVESVSSRTDRYVVIEPGERPKEKCQEIADFLNAPLDEVIRVLPGRFRAVEYVEG